MFRRYKKSSFVFFAFLIAFLLINIGQTRAAGPGAPTLITPTDGSTGVSISPTLEVTVTDPESETMTVTFYGRLAGPAPAEDFTIIAIPDTQHYTDNPANEANFAAQTQWIVDNKDSQNIVFVTGLGDIVQNGDANEAEWQIADAAYSLIEDPITTSLLDGIPYGLAAGNHDQSPIGGGSEATTIYYNQYFGQARFNGRGYYGGHFGSDNDNHYELFSAGGMDFIAIHLEYDTSPEQDVLDWVDGLLTTHSDRRAMVTTHYMIGLGDPGSWGTQGQAIYNALSDHENLFLMLGGHIHGEGKRQDIGSNGNVINTLLSDYQDLPNGGDGWLRIMEFSPANDTITVSTYSPVLEQYGTDMVMGVDTTSEVFTLAYDMVGGDPYVELGMVSGVPSGGNASIVWPGLAGLTEYEWYVTVDDGNSPLTTSDTWSFTTMDPPPGIVPPETTIDVNPLDPSNSNTASFEFNGTDAANDNPDPTLTFECDLDGGGYTGCTSPIGYSGLSEGAHTFKVRATDTDGNTDPVPASFSWTIDFTPTIEIRVNQESDDAEEWGDGVGTMYLNSTDLEMIYDDDNDVNQEVGLRFQDVGIPTGSTVVNAYIEFVADSDDGGIGASSLMIYGHDADDSTTFVGTNFDITSRTKTTASSVWNPGLWIASTQYQTTDITAIVQEIVDRGGWASGNAMAFIISGTLGDQVRAESFDGFSSYAPLLVIEFSSIPLTCYPLTLNHSGMGSDPVASPTNSTGCSSGEYVEGESISLSGAVPASGWEVSGWTGTDYNNSTSATNSVTMPASAHTASVTYTEIPLFDLVVNYVGNGNAILNPTGGLYEEDTLVTLTAVADTGWHFDYWTGDLSGSNNPKSIILDQNKIVTATFAIDTFVLEYAAGANGNLTGDISQVVNYGEVGTTVTAVPVTGYHFVQWSDGSTDNPRTDTNVMADVNVMATFAIDTFTLKYAAGSNGTLTGNTTQTVEYGEDGIAVEAIPATDFHFVNWSDGSTENPRIDTNVTNNISVTANFAIEVFLPVILVPSDPQILTELPSVDLDVDSFNSDNDMLKNIIQNIDRQQSFYRWILNNISRFLKSS